MTPQYLNPLVHSMGDIKEHTSQRIQVVKDIVNDIANQKWSQAEDTKKVVIFKIHQSFDQVFAMMVNIAVLFNNSTSSSSSSYRSKGNPFPSLQEIARLIGESKHSIEHAISYKVSQSELASRLLDDTQRVLGKAREMISEYPLKDTVISNRVVNGILTSLEDAIHKVLKQSRVEYRQLENKDDKELDTYHSNENENDNKGYDDENREKENNESYENNENNEYSE